MGTPILGSRVGALYGTGLLLAGLLCWSHTATAQQQPPARLWDKTYGGKEQDEPTSIVPTADGGCVIAGSSSSGASGTRSQPSQGKRDYWLIKLSAQGEQQWDQRFGGPEEDLCAVVRPTADGGYLLGGTSASSYGGGDKSERGLGAHDFWIVKTNSQGQKEWEKTTGSFEDDRLHDIAETEDGGYLLAGEANGNTFANTRESYDFFVDKLSQQGQPEWSRTYGGTEDEELRVVRRTPDHGFLLAGTSSSPVGQAKTHPSRGGQDYWVVKISPLGQKEWDFTYGGPGEDVLSSMQLTPDGGFILGGTSTSGVGGEKTQSSRGGKDMWVVKVNAAGAVEWDRRFGGSQEDNLAAIQLVSGGYLLGGSSWSPGNGDKQQANLGYSDYWLLRLDQQGNVQWERRYGGNGLDEINALALTTDGSCLVAGFSTSSNLPLLGDKTAENYGFVNYWIIKMAGFVPLRSAEPSWARQLAVFPVPASTTLRVGLPALSTGAEVTLTLLDALGRAVRVQSTAISAAQAQEIALPVTSLPAGSYWLRVAMAGQAPLHRRIVIE